MVSPSARYAFRLSCLRLCAKNLATYGKLSSDGVESVAKSLYARDGEGARIHLDYQRDCLRAAIKEAQDMLALVDSLSGDATAFNRERGES